MLNADHHEVDADDDGDAGCDVDDDACGKSSLAAPPSQADGE